MNNQEPIFLHDPKVSALKYKQIGRRLFRQDFDGEWVLSQRDPNKLGGHPEPVDKLTNYAQEEITGFKNNGKPVPIRITLISTGESIEYSSTTTAVKHFTGITENPLRQLVRRGGGEMNGFLVERLD